MGAIKCPECGTYVNSAYYSFHEPCCQDFLNLEKDKKDNIIWGTHDYFDNKDTGEDVK